MVYALALAVFILALWLGIRVNRTLDEIEQQEANWQHFLKTGEDYPWKS